MCGIVGCIGRDKLVSWLVEGLEKLEYRGYDSAGIAVHNGQKICIYKAEGKLDNLKHLLNGNREDSSIKAGIGHIRWATHGVPNEVNAHPHCSFDNKVSIVHNGIIENYKELRKELNDKGFVFKSQTDTEVIAHLIEEQLGSSNDYIGAIRGALKKLNGAYALGVIFNENSDVLYAARKSAPLILGVGEGCNFIASDVPALLEQTKNVIYLEDGEIAEIKCNSYKLSDIDGNVINKEPEVLPWEPVAISKNGYKHFMLKEIHEQPDVIRQTLFDKLRGISLPLNLKEVNLTKKQIANLDRIQIIACGTSLHAALVGKYLIEEFTGIPVDVEASSEYIYKRAIVGEDSLTIGVSQSGETADTITAIKQAKAMGSHILVITNRPDSTMARDADSLLPVNAGFEVSVAATKSYSAQLLAFYLFAIYLAETRKSLQESKSTSRSC